MHVFPPFIEFQGFKVTINATTTAILKLDNYLDDMSPADYEKRYEQLSRKVV